jgi:hypothetical protein
MTEKDRDLLRRLENLGLMDVARTLRQVLRWEQEMLAGAT